MNKKQIEKELAELEELRATAEQAAGEYSEIAQQMARDLQEFVDGKSEKWQEGDTGQAYSDLISELEGIDIDVPEVPGFGG